MIDTNGDGQILRSDLKQAKQPIFNNVTYDTIKDIVTIGFPAATALYSGLAVLWGWPFAEQVVSSGALLVTFLGVLLKISGKRFEKLPVEYDGELIANDPDPMHDTFRLELDKGLAQLGSQDEVRVKVVDLLPKEDSQ